MYCNKDMTYNIGTIERVQKEIGAQARRTLKSKVKEHLAIE